MAQLVGVLHMSHGPFTNLPAEEWEAIRVTRDYRSDVPVETEEERHAKAGRAKNALGILRKQLDAMKPDVIMTIGDDQNECFGFDNFPALWVYVGESFAGPTPATHGKPELFDHVAGHPELAVHTLRSLLGDGFDPAFSQSLPNPQEGMCHAIMRPFELLGDLYDIPTVPVLVNGYYPPQPSAHRCYQVGRALRKAIDSFPQDLRVVVIGSGGMWHTPKRKQSYLDEEFDNTLLQHLERGDILGMAEHFDAYRVPEGDQSQDISRLTGMPSESGPQMGTREICNWIVAAATADERPHVIVDYVPIYASPIGTAFAYCADI